MWPEEAKNKLQLGECILKSQLVLNYYLFDLSPQQRGGLQSA